MPNYSTSDCHCISYTSLSQKTLVNSELEGVGDTWRIAVTKHNSLVSIDTA